MGNLVDGQGAGLAEAFAAIAALEGLVLGVDVAMIPQVILSPEGLAANVAGVGPLIRVGPLVDEEVVGLGELPVAVLADELLLWATAAGGSTTGRTDCTEDDFFFYYFCSLGCDCDCELLARIFHLHLWPECELDSVDFPFQAFPMPGGCPAL